MKVTAVELSDEEISDIIDRAPQACRYWATFDLERYDDAIVAHHEGGTAPLDKAAVHRGVCLALTFRHWLSGSRRALAATAFDLGTVDSIVQYGLFGKLVYG